ncbi:MAG TPA: SDR family NAD(P)-dependent oxidoreductase [Candidatus Binatia bacterium]|nr:SDR family NAD(P)-dependent oxidoreductase [Candidatus Binatia bacterium]
MLVAASAPASAATVDGKSELESETREAQHGPARQEGPGHGGASSGIGHATAHALAAQGATLALSGRNVARLEELADLIASHGHVRPVVLAADLSKRGAAESLAVQAVEALGHIDVLINNPAAEGVGVLRRRRRRRGFA